MLGIVSQGLLQQWMLMALPRPTLSFFSPQQGTCKACAEVCMLHSCPIHIFDLDSLHMGRHGDIRELSRYQCPSLCMNAGLHQELIRSLVVTARPSPGIFELLWQHTVGWKLQERQQHRLMSRWVWVPCSVCSEHAGFSILASVVPHLCCAPSHCPSAGMAVIGTGGCLKQRFVLVRGSMLVLCSQGVGLNLIRAASKGIQLRRCSLGPICPLGVPEVAPYCQEATLAGYVGGTNMPGGVSPVQRCASGQQESKGVKCNPSLMAVI